MDLSSHLEEQAVAWHDNPVIISTFGPDEPLLPEFFERYAALADQGSFVAVIVVGPNDAGALVARRVDDDVYDFAVTHDRRLTVEAGRSLLRRLDDGR